MLGTVHNPPTEAGMRDQLAILERIAATQPLAVDVAGFGTERLARESKTLRFLGAVSPEQLDGLLMTTRGLLLHQRSAAGAVTRIAEMLTAGIPVIGNPIACRSAIELPGVHVYGDERELAALAAHAAAGAAADRRVGERRGALHGLRAAIGVLINRKCAGARRRGQIGRAGLQRAVVKNGQGGLSSRNSGCRAANSCAAAAG